MDPIDRLTKLMEALARQQSSGAERPFRTNARTPPSTHASQTPAKIGITQLQRKISERLKGLDARDRGHCHRAARIFFETVLTWEFGDRLIHDPRFAELIQEVESRMTHDPELADRFGKLLQQLMSS